jgi:hypothetical protein
VTGLPLQPAPTAIAASTSKVRALFVMVEACFPAETE